MFEILNNLKALGIYPIPIIIVCLITSWLKTNVYFMFEKPFKSLLSLLTGFVLSAIIIIPFVLSEFSVLIYIQNVIISSAVGGYSVDIINIIKKHFEK